MKLLLIKFWRLIPHKHKAKTTHPWRLMICDPNGEDGQTLEVCRCFAYRTNSLFYGKHAYWNPWTPGTL